MTVSLGEHIHASNLEVETINGVSRTSLELLQGATSLGETYDDTNIQTQLDAAVADIGVTSTQLATISATSGQNKAYIQWYLPGYQSYNPGISTIINTSSDIMANISHNSSTGKITLQRAGVYEIAFHVQLTTPSSAGTLWAQVLCFLNNTQILTSNVHDGQDIYYNNVFSGTMLIDAPINSTIHFQIQAQPSAIELIGSIGNIKQTWFSCKSID